MDEKALLHAKRWVLYFKEKEKLVKVKYSVEVVGHDKKKVLWEVVWWKSPMITLTSDLGGLILIFLMKTRRGL